MSLDPLRWPTPAAIAHRGSRLLWPENTMEAFAGAVAMGYRRMETDLHITGDGAVVCLHDHTVDRTTNGTGDVSSHTLAELQAFDAGYRHRGREGFVFRGRGIHVPALEEALTAFPDVNWVVDLKVDGLAEALAALLNRLGAHERLIAGSFEDRRLDELRDATGGRVAVSAGRALACRWFLASRVGRGVRCGASALLLPARMRGVKIVDCRLVAAAHSAGLPVHVWTVNNPDEMEDLLEMGVDGLVTDRPDVLKQLLIVREEWAR